jgi:hypothetical protein
MGHGILFFWIWYCLGQEPFHQEGGWVSPKNPLLPSLYSTPELTAASHLNPMQQYPLQTSIPLIYRMVLVHPEMKINDRRFDLHPSFGRISAWEESFLAPVT